MFIVFYPTGSLITSSWIDRGEKKSYQIRSILIGSLERINEYNQIEWDEAWAGHVNWDKCRTRAGTKEHPVRLSVNENENENEKRIV